MAKNTGENCRDKLLAVGTDLMRRSGYAATTVDEICTSAGVTKGAFFHHFPAKEALAEACLEAWTEQMATMHRTAAYQSIADPAEKVLAAIDFMIDAFAGEDVQKSCLAGTTVQEISETNPVLREAAHCCLHRGEAYFKTLLDAAGRHRHLQLDSTSLAELWMGTIQGSLLLAKASRDPTVIQRNLTHLKQYIASLLNESVTSK
jgi:TetR/AcrR family transcriptional repressor of nem operon